MQRTNKCLDFNCQTLHLGYREKHYFWTQLTRITQPSAHTSILYCVELCRAVCPTPQHPAVISGGPLPNPDPLTLEVGWSPADMTSVAPISRVPVDHQRALQHRPASSRRRQHLRSILSVGGQYGFVLWLVTTIYGYGPFDNDFSYLTNSRK